MYYEDYLIKDISSRLEKALTLGKPPKKSKKISQQVWTMGGSANFGVWTSKKCFF